MTTVFLTELLLLLAVATAGVVAFERLRLPSIAGFLVIGALVGPGGLGLISDPERVRELAELGTEAARLKWPNDIVVDQDGALRKLGGILVQAESAGEETAAVIGIGVNGSLSAGAVQRIDQPWIDLASLGGTPGWAELAATVINHCVEVVQVFAAQGLPALLSDWQRLDALSQRPIRIVIGEQSFDAVALGVEADGALRCRLADGSQRSFASGEVTLRAR